MRWARHPEVLHRSTSLGPVVLRPGSARPERVEGLGSVVLELLELLGPDAGETELAERLAELGSTADTGDALVELERRGLAVRVP